MLPALLEESGTTSRFLRMRDRLGAVLALALCAAGLAACGGGERQDEDEPEGEFPVEIVSAEFPAKQRLAETSDLLLSVQNTGDETIPDLAVTIFTVANEDNATEVDASAAETDAADEEDLAEEVEQQLQEELQAAEDEEAEEAGTDATVGDGRAGAERGGGALLGDLRAARPGDPLAAGLDPRAGLSRGWRGPSPGPARPARSRRRAAPSAVQTNTFSFGALEPDETIDLVWRVTPVQAGTYTVHYRVAAGLQGKAVAVTEDGSVPEGEFVVQITDVPPQTRVNDAGKVVPIKPERHHRPGRRSEQQSELEAGGTATNP